MLRFTPPSPLCYKLLQGKSDDLDTSGLSSEDIRDPRPLPWGQCPFLGRIQWVYLQVGF